ncbi:CHAT domain-containing protein [Mycena epipterygia]|nr:CHAT domain-containing protein [Mycena epipterygia]
MENNSPPESSDPSPALELVALADSILRDYMAESSLANLHTAIYLLAQTWVNHNPQDSECLNLLATALLTRFSYTGQWKDVQIACIIHGVAMKVLRSEILGVLTELVSDVLQMDDNPDDIVTLAGNTLKDFHQHATLSSLDTAICLYEEAISGQDSVGIDKCRTMRQLVNAYLIQLHTTGDTEGVQKSISLARQLYGSQPNQVSWFCATLLSEVNFTNVVEVIALIQETLKVDNNGLELAETGTEFFEVFSQAGDDLNLDMGISALETAAAQVTWGHHQRESVLNNLGNALFKRFQTRGSPQDLDKAIALHHEALDLHPAPHPERGRSLNNLAISFYERFETRGDAGDLDNAIVLHREALDLRPAPHPNRGSSLSNLANGLHRRFQTRGDTGDLDNAIALHCEALDLCPAPHPDCGSSLNNLAIVLYERFQSRGASGDLDNAIGLHRKALDLRPAPHPEHGSSLNNLAIVLHERFKTRGDVGDLDNAIELHREALDLRPAPHPDHSRSLNNLATVLHERFQSRGDVGDLDNAIKLHHEALDLCPAPHPDHGNSLNSLATVLYQRFQSRGDVGDLDNAIVLHREALDLCPAPHPHRGTLLATLSSELRNRFQIRGDAGDLDTAIVQYREVLDLHQAPHPERGRSLSNLANGLHQRFQTRGDMEDLDNAIKLSTEAQVTFQPPHPHRGMVLKNLATQLMLKHDNSSDHTIMENAIIAFRESSGYLPSPVSQRCEAAISWARHADKNNHNSAMEAYETSVELLPQQAMLGLDIQSRQKALTLKSTIGLATNAAACASQLNEIGKAVEFLEAGCSVFWSQALQLHTSLDDLKAVHPELAERIQNLSKKLEVGSHRAVASIRILPAVHKDHRTLDKDDLHYRKLNVEWVQALDEVRQYPGFQRFLRPKLMNELKAAAINGPIIILNASRSSCTAFIVTLSRDVQSVNLENLTWDRAQLLVDLLRALLSQNNVHIIQTLTKIQGRETSTGFPTPQERLGGTVETSEHHTPNKVFGWLLGELWALIVQPVFHALELKKSDHPSRLWWCPTGPFTFLPIHAAGLYTPKETDCVPDYVVSSYTQTLATLLNPPTQTASPFKMTAVIQPTTDNCSDLPATVEELVRIKQQVPSQWLTSLGDTTPATVDVALQHMQESSVVHFACHGTQDLQNPLETGLLLTDGRLKVSELMRGKSQKKSMTLAFLSACETAKGDDTVPDEAMHLAATLLFAGFRGVVATMWTMADPDGPAIAETFYRHLFKGCDPNMDPLNLPDLTKAAEFLHIAVAKLRADPNVPFSRWVPFVHYGL